MWQCLAAGLVDVTELDLVPAVFGAGERLFERVGKELLGPRLVGTVATPQGVQLRFECA